MTSVHEASPLRKGEITLYSSDQPEAGLLQGRFKSREPGWEIDWNISNMLPETLRSPCNTNGTPEGPLGHAASLVLQLQKKRYMYINIPTSHLLFLPQIQIISLHQSLLPVKIHIKQHELPVPNWTLYFNSPNNETGTRKFSALNPAGWLNHHIKAASISATNPHRHIRRWFGSRALKCRPWCHQFIRELWLASTSSYSLQLQTG